MHPRTSAAILFLALPPAATAADDANKRAYMVAGCYQCHGTVGQGGVGPRLAPQPMPLAALTAFLRHSARSMPAYDAKILPDEDVKRIFDYLSSIPASPPADQIPQLKP